MILRGHTPLGTKPGLLWVILSLDVKLLAVETITVLKTESETK